MVRELHFNEAVKNLTWMHDLCVTSDPGRKGTFSVLTFPGKGLSIRTHKFL